MSTHGHIVYETPEGKFLMRTHLNDSYIHNPGLGKALLDSFKQEEHIQGLFELNMDLSTIADTEKRYREQEATSIKENGLKKHKEYTKRSFDSLVYINGRAVKAINFLDNKNESDLQFDTLQDCQKKCREEYVYLYKQSNKSWHLEVGNDFITLQDAIYIDKKVFDIVWIDEMKADCQKMASPGYLPKTVSSGAGPVPLDQTIMGKLEFKKNKICYQLLTYVSSKEVTKQHMYQQFFEKCIENKYTLEEIESGKTKYELYLLNRKLNKQVQMKPIENKKLKI